MPFLRSSIGLEYSKDCVLWLVCDHSLASWFHPGMSTRSFAGAALRDLSASPPGLHLHSSARSCASVSSSNSTMCLPMFGRSLKLWLLGTTGQQDCVRIALLGSDIMDEILTHCPRWPRSSSSIAGVHRSTSWHRRYLCTSTCCG